jgi:hypothetical protein
MTDFYVRWGDDVQPYILQLASEHIETLRQYCHEAARRILTSRRRKRAVTAITARVKRSMLNGSAFHCFKMFGFNFQLCEGSKKERARKQEFVLNFSAAPDFRPEDMPPRLRRIGGEPLSARPSRRRRPHAAAPARAQGARSGKGKKRKLERIAYRSRQFSLWIRGRGAALASSLATKLYKMHRAYQRLSAQIAVMWRRRPRLAFPRGEQSFLTLGGGSWADAPARARLEPRLIGESRRLLLFTFVSREPVIDWSAYPFGQLPDENERMAV